jgi:PilZ domain
MTAELHKPLSKFVDSLAPMKLAFDQYALDARYSPEPQVPEFAMRGDTCMQSDSGKRAKESGVRDRRYSIRHPFAAEVEMLELKSGSRVSWVTSDLSLGGCFVCARRTLEVGARVCGTLTRGGQKAEMLAVVRVVKPEVGMGLEFLNVDRESNATLMAWIEKLRKSR